MASPAVPPTEAASTVNKAITSLSCYCAMYTQPVHRMAIGLSTGAYVFGKTEARTKVVNGRARNTIGHFKPQSSWTVLIREHHPGYISWERFERNQEIIASNSNMKSRMLRKSGRGGRRYWRKMLSSRSWQGQIWWKKFQQIKERFPLLRPKLYLRYSELQAIATL